MPSEQDNRKKRSRDDGTEKGVATSGLPAAGVGEQQEVKRRRVDTVTYGLGAFAGLVGKAFRATASVFGRGGGQQQQSSAPQMPGGNAVDRDGQVGNRRCLGQASGEKLPPVSPKTTAPRSPRLETSQRHDGARMGDAGANRVITEDEEKRRTQQQPREQQQKRRQQCQEERDRLSLQGLPNLDSDALRHALGFLVSSDLARFAWTSSAARDIVSGHAALVIAEKYSDLRLGVRDQRLQTSPRRLAFGTGAATGQAGFLNGGGADGGAAAAAAAAAAAGNNSSGAAVGGGGASAEQAGAGGGNGVPVPVPVVAPVGGVPLPAPPFNNESANSSTNNNQSSHSDLWDQEVVVGPTSSGRTRGSPSVGGGVVALGGRVRRRDRYARIGGGNGAELSRWGGRNLDLALPALHHLESCGELLVRQLKTLPRLDLFRTLQSRAVLGPSQYLTAHMRAVLVDWCVEVAFQFRLSTISLHAAVSALDVCLSKVAVPRCRLQLLGVVCAMIQSQAGGGCQVMSTAEAIHICDSQYNPSQVHSTFNIVVSNTQEATARTVPATAAEILHKHLLSMGEASGLERPLSADWEKLSHVKEEYVLAGLLIDLSLLDQYMFRFRPGTLSSAALFLARVTAIYYSKEELWVTPFAVVEKTNREVLRLYGKGVCSPFVELNEELEQRPFGAPGLGEFVASEPREAAAVRKCIERLWLVQQDFFKHLSGLQSPHSVLFQYQHMFKGIKDKFVPTGSKRLQAYQRLGLIQRGELDRMLNMHLPTTVAPAFDPAMPIPPAAAEPAPPHSEMPPHQQQQPSNGGNAATTAAPVGS